MEKLDTSFYMLGWGGATTDAIFTLKPVLHSRNDKGAGINNWGNVKDVKLDAMIDALEGEVDKTKRQRQIIEAIAYHTDMIFHLPLHRQMIPWATRANVEVVHRPDNWLETIWVKIK